MLRTICFAIALFTASACASGTSLVTGTQRAPTAPESVRVLLEQPAGGYEVIGAVTTSSALGMTAQQNQDRALNQAKERAAAMGANAIIVDYVGAPGGAPSYVGVNTGGVMTMAPTTDAGDREVRARAIFIQQ